MGSYARFIRQIRISLAILVIFGGVLTAAAALGKHTRTVDSHKMLLSHSVARRRSATRAARTDDLERVYASLPLSFEPNEGQTSASVQYMAHGADYVVFLDRAGATISVEQQPDNSRVFPRISAKDEAKLERRKGYQAFADARRRWNRRLMRIGLDGANPSARVEALGELPGKSSYFVGNDPQKWLRGVSNYSRVRYVGVYPGVNLVYYGTQGRLEFDFVVSPGSDPKQIKLRFGRHEHIGITRNGNLQVGSFRSAVLLHRPAIYQVEHGKRHPVQGRFALFTDGRIGIHVGAYNRHEPLIIDPVLAYSTYFEGSSCVTANAIVVDSSGDTYVAGETQSPNFPTTANGYQTTGLNNWVAFVSEFNPTGTALLYSTFLGAGGSSYARAIAIDPSANVYVTGYSYSTNFPIVNGFQTTNNNPTWGNAFIARINTTQNGTASLIYSSYLGGGGDAQTANVYASDLGMGIAADSSGIAYVTGFTTSDTSVVPFPTTASAYQSTLRGARGNAFLTAVNTNQSGAASLVYSTYLGGDGTGGFNGDLGAAVATDNSGDAYIVGQTTSDSSGPFPTTASAFQSTLNSSNGNGFITEIATTQSGSQSLIYSTYFGGSTTNPDGDYAGAVALDSTGKVYVAGDAQSSNFPVTSGVLQTTNSANGTAFVAKFDLTQSGGQSLVYSTFLGGTNGSMGDAGEAVAVDPSGDAFIFGDASSSNFPVTSDAFQATLKSTQPDTFLSELNPTATALLYSTYFGGSGGSLWDLAEGLALDSLGDNAYVAGVTESTDFPIYPPTVFQPSFSGYQISFVAKFAIQLQIGSFMPVGTLVAPVSEQTATLLQNGQVLLAGGYTFDNVSNNAELYNPTTQTFAATGPMGQARFEHTATLLPNGMVLIAGGIGSSGTLGSAELYNPATGTFSSTGNMNTTREGHTATLLKNGQVLIAGGDSNGTAELYNPASGTFTLTGSLVTGRSYHTATLLDDGTVLLAGGQTPLQNILSSAEIYNPTTGTFAATTGNLNDGSEYHTATLLNNGSVLIAGGSTSATNGLARTEIYSPATQTFTLSANLLVGVSSQTATELNDGTVLIAGGGNNAGPTATAQVFNPSNQTITAVGSLELARTGHTATLLNDGTVLVAGGSQYNGQPIALSELYAITQPQPYSLQITPTTVNMQVGGTQQFTAVNNLGDPVSDVTWTVGNYSLASITSTSDSSPTLTALAAGQLTLTASDGTASAQAQITIVSSGSMTPGTPFWSVANTSGYSSQQLAQAMPSPGGPDMYSIQLSNSGTQSLVQAMTSDGQQLWQTTITAANNNSVPDAFGGLLVTGNQTCNLGQTTPMSIVDLNPASRQALWQVTAQGTPGPRNTTIYCYPDAPQIAVRASVDGAVIISAPGNTSGLPELSILNGQTGQPQSNQPYIPPSSYQSSDGTWLNGYSPIGPPIVGSDGTVYVEYEVVQVAYPPQTTSATLYLMAITTNEEGSNVATSTELSSTTANENLFPEKIIPDGQGGVLASWVIAPASGPMPTNPYQAAHVVSGSVAATYSLPFTPTNFVLGPDGLPIQPVLILGENGTVFATDGQDTNDSTNHEGPKVVGFNLASGTLNWFYQETSTSATFSIMTAIDGNGLLVNDSQNGVLQISSSGNASTVAGSLGGVAQPSWSANWTLQTAQGVSAPFLSSITVADSFWAMPGGNESSNGGAIEQVSTNQTQGTAEQLPQTNAAPPCTFEAQPPSPLPLPLCTNYNAIELSTIVPPSQIFSRYIQTYLGLQSNAYPPPPPSLVATVTNGTDITGSGQNVTFTAHGALAWGLNFIQENPFQVQSERFDTSADVLSAVTLQGHPIAGWRYWRVYSIGTDDVVVETGAVDSAGPGTANYYGYWAFRGAQLKLWQEYLEFIPNDLKTSKLDPGAAELINSTYPVNGVWNPASPSQSDILYQVCQASTCH